MNQNLIEDAKRGGYISEIIRRLTWLDKTVRMLLARPAGAGGGSGDVVGPASATDGHVALFDGATGKLIKDAGSGFRELLSAARTYYVRTGGNDANTGLVNTDAGAFLTIQHAYDVCTAIDIGAYSVTIQIADGTYNEDVSFNTGCNGPVTIQGNAGTPANVIVNAADSCFRATIVLAFSLTIKDLKMTAGNAGINHSGQGYIYFGNIDFGACTNYHVLANGIGAVVQAISNYAITAGVAIHWACIKGGTIVVGGYTITISNNPAWGYVFALTSQGLGEVHCVSDTFNGASTGTRYLAEQNGVIFTNGAGANYLPGNAAGSTATGGLYI